MILNKEEKKKMMEYVVCFNNKIDASGYFEEINIANKSFNKSFDLVLLSILIITSFYVYYLLPFIFLSALMIIGALVSYMVLYIVFSCVFANFLSYKRVSISDTKKLLDLRFTGEKTESVVNKIVSQHEDGFLSYKAIFDNIEELSVAYNEERSIELNKVFNKI